MAKKNKASSKKFSPKIKGNSSTTTTYTSAPVISTYKNVEMILPHRASPKVEFKSDFPMVLVDPRALDKIQVFVGYSQKEIGWLGSVKKEGNTYILTDVFMVSQEVESTTCEITQDGLTEFATEILSLDGGVDIWNSIKLWGHSHVHMGVEPSGQDWTQLNSLSESHDDWFLMLIANKKGNMKFFLADKEKNIVISDLQWGLYVQQSAIDEQSIVEEMNSKVKSLRSSYSSGNTTAYTYTYVNPCNSKSYESRAPLYNDEATENVSAVTEFLNRQYMEELAEELDDKLTELELMISTPPFDCLSYADCLELGYTRITDIEEFFSDMLTEAQNSRAKFKQKHHFWDLCRSCTDYLEGICADIESEAEEEIEDVKPDK